jgi:hypothetical protein
MVMLLSVVLIVLFVLLGVSILAAKFVEMLSK